MRIKPFPPPPGWTAITTIDAHTAGEPFRVITGGLPDLPGDTILARRRYARDHLDHLRTALMWEPRGHADMYGCIVTPPVSEGADFGVLFTHNEGYSSMCGHGIIGIATVMVETGSVAVREPETVLRIDTPAGPVTARVAVAGGRAGRVRFENVPSFALALDQRVAVPGHGTVRYDLAFGGAFYAFVQAADLGLRCVPGDFAALVAAGRAIKQAVMADRSIPHPFEEDLSFLYGTIFIDPPRAPGRHSRNVCIFADGELDRSPTGTGVSARLAIHHARGEIGIDQPITIESILGTCFEARVVSAATFGPHAAVIPEVAGTAHITGCHTFLIDPADPLQTGFVLR